MKNGVYLWLRLLWSKSVALAFASGVTAILYAGLFYIINLFWILYLETPVGKRFLALHIVDVGTIEGLLSENFLLLSLEIILAVLTACLIFGAVSQIFLLIRYFHEGRGFFYRLIVWGVPCVALTAVAISNIYERGLMASFLLAVVPTIALFQSCLRFTSGLLPDISTVIGDIMTLARKALKKEKRGEPRYDMSLLLAYHGPRSNGECRSTASQISNHGFCIREPKDLMNGDIIRFELKVEDDSINGEAVIKWIKHLNSTDRKKVVPDSSGCRIVSMATDYRALLRNYLRRHFF